MNEIVNKFVLVGDKFMPEIHLKQQGFTYSACGPFTKNRERFQKFKETVDTSYIYKKKLDKACFQHDVAYGDFKELKRRTASDKILRDKTFNIAKNSKYDVDIHQEGLLLWFIIFLIKSRNEAVLLIMRLNKIFNSLKNYTNPLLENLKKEKFIQDLDIIFGVLI